MSEASRNAQEVRAGAVLSYVVLGLQLIVALVYTPIMLRLLGQSEFGLYSLVVSIVGYLGLLSFGFGGSYLRFYWQFREVGDWEGVRLLNGTFLMVFSSLGVIAALCGIVLSVNVEAVLGGQFSATELDTARVLFAILAVNLLITFPATVFSSHIIAQERFVFLKSLQIVGTIVGPLIVIPLLLSGYQSVGVAVGTTVVNLGLTIGTIVYSCLKLRMKFAFRGLRFSLLRDVSIFSSYLFINMVVDQINWNVDKYIIGRYLGAASVATYAVAAIVNMSYISLATAISSVLGPRVNRMVASAKSDSEVSDLFTRVGRVQFLVLGLVVSGFVFFGYPFVRLWAGPAYSEAYVIAVVLMVSVTFPLIQNLGIEIQKAKDLHQFRSWVYLAVAVGNVVLSIPLTQRYGGVGAAVATACSLVIGNVVLMNWHYGARVGLDMRNFWRQIARVSLGMVPGWLVGLLIARFAVVQDWVSLILFGLVYVLAYAASSWWLGMNHYERELFGGPIGRLVRRMSRT